MYNIDEIKNKIICGDCLEELKKFPDNSIDTIITDPPYNLVSITKRFGKENSKPAQYGNDGSFSRLSKGFMGKEWDGTGIAFNKEVWEECLRVLKPGGHLLSFGGTRTYHRMASAIEDAGFEIRDMLEWIFASGFPKSQNIGKMYDKKMGNKREEYNPGGRYKYQFQEGNSQFVSQTATHSGKRISLLPTKGFSKWEGYGTALKPAHEPICMAMKPLSEKTFVDNIVKWGTGGLQIDECRIPVEKPISIHDAPKGTFAGGEQNRGSIKNYRDNTLGRFPANILCQDDALNDSYSDSGSKSRYFDIDKWNEKHGLLQFPKASKKERNMGLKNITEPTHRPIGVAFNDKSKVHREKNKGNTHPTVKPLKLMLYLVSLVSREGQIVLDPFAGSFTTGVACILLKRRFIGIEKEKEYLAIGEARMEWAKKEITEKEKQRIIF